MKEPWKAPDPRRVLLKEAWKTPNPRRVLLKEASKAPSPRRVLFREANGQFWCHFGPKAAQMIQMISFDVILDTFGPIGRNPEVDGNTVQ